MSTITDLIVLAKHLLWGRSQRGLSLCIPGNPVAASRPRVSKWGTYYGKTYKKFREHAAQALADFKSTYGAAPLGVITRIVVMKPKTTKRSYPRGDIDNFEKAAWDAITNSPAFWDDDDQIVLSVTSKEYTQDESAIGFHLNIFNLEGCL